MMEKAYSLFLCILLISVVFLPSTAAGRVLLHTAQTEDEGGHHGRNDGNKSAVSGSTSKPDSSKDGFSSPSEPIPTRQTAGQAVACSKSAYRDCLRPKNRGPPVPVCKPYNRSC